MKAGEIGTLSWRTQGLHEAVYICEDKINLLHMFAIWNKSSQSFMHTWVDDLDFHIGNVVWHPHKTVAIYIPGQSNQPANPGPQVQNGRPGAVTTKPTAHGCLSNGQPVVSNGNLHGFSTGSGVWGGFQDSDDGPQPQAPWTKTTKLPVNPLVQRFEDHKDCEVVENHALGKKFWYCRNHKVEVIK